MQIPLTVIILVNSKDNLSNCINSIDSLATQTIMINLTKETLNLTNENVHVVNIKNKTSRAKICNDLLAYTSTDWHLYIKSTERLIQGKEEIIDIVIGNLGKAYNAQILESNVIKKETRLWRKDKDIIFQNPYLERIKAVDPLSTTITFYAQSDEMQWNELKNIKINVLEKETYYYKALYQLKQKNYDEFKKLAEYYLFYSDDNSIGSTMIKYYLATIDSIKAKNHDSAIKRVIQCITVYPLMAEFWCLLGDIFFQNYEFKKSISFYENAIILGSKRLNSDYWPIHIEKYREYPQKMIDKCKSILDKVELFSIQ